MTLHHSTRIPLIGALALLLTSCGGNDFTVGGRELPTPEEPGIYALDPEGELVRLDGNPEWERKSWGQRSDLSPDTQFIVLDPTLAGGAPRSATPATLTRVAWLRSELEPSGLAAPVSGSQWVTPNLESFTEPLTLTWHPKIAGFVHLQPADDRLDPGLYELTVHSESRRHARVGIQWTGVDKRQYSAANCVDRMVAYDMRYEPCTAQPYIMAQSVSDVAAPAPVPAPAATAQGLKISLDRPVPEHGGLTVRGKVRNISAMAQTVPTMRGTLLDASGRPTDSWLFSAPTQSIGPGGEVAFTTWVPTSEGASRLNVDFAG